MSFVELTIGAIPPEAIEVSTKMPRSVIHNYKLNKKLNVIYSYQILNLALFNPIDLSFMPHTRVNEDDYLNVLRFISLSKLKDINYLKKEIIRLLKSYEKHDYKWAKIENWLNIINTRQLLSKYKTDKKIRLIKYAS